MRQSFLAALLALGLAWLPAAPAHALQFGTSSDTKKSATIIPFRTGGTFLGPLGVELGVRVIPGLHDLLPALPTAANPLAAGGAYSMLIDGEIDLTYRQPLAEISLRPLGHFNPVLMPYVGYRHLAVPRAEGEVSLFGGPNTIANLSQFGGIAYGVRANTDLPLGFSLYTGLGMTTLTSGSYDQRQNSLNVTSSGKIDPGRMTLPGFQLGGRWSLFNVLELSVGYELFRLPSQLQSLAPTLNNDQTQFNNLNVGVRLLGFSI